MSTASFKHKNGRPTKTGQLQIERELRPYFEQGISATLTAEKTGINIKTVCDYFDHWVEKISKSEESDFFERQRNERMRIIISYDCQILDANKHFDDIDEQINQFKKENKPIPGYLFSLRSDAMKFRSQLTEKKGIFSMQPTMDEVLIKYKDSNQEFAFKNSKDWTINVNVPVVFQFVLQLPENIEEPETINIEIDLSCSRNVFGILSIPCVGESHTCNYQNQHVEHFGPDYELMN